MPLLILFLVAALAGLVVVGLASVWPEANVAAPAPIATATRAFGESVARHRRLRAFVSRRLDPEVMTGLALTIALVLAIAGGVVLGILTYLVRSNGYLRHIDASVAAWGYDHAGPVSTHGLDAITQMGNIYVVVGLAVLVAIVESVRAPSRWIVPFLIVALGGEEFLTTAVKDLANRARPPLNPVAVTLGPSFPSGHAATAAAFYASAALLLARRRPTRWRLALAGLAVAVAVGVAASRVLLDLHWLSDVVAGVALGWAWFAICSIFFGGRLLQFAAPAEQVAQAADAPAAAAIGQRSTAGGDPRKTVRA